MPPKYRFIQISHKDIASLDQIIIMFIMLSSYYSVHYAACETFHFKSTLSNTDVCKLCPSFSNASEIASGVCPCDDGYFRPNDGSEDDIACTREYTLHARRRCIL